MSLRNYLITCLAVSALVVLTILFVPGVSSTLESHLLAFLAANATG